MSRIPYRNALILMLTFTMSSSFATGKLNVLLIISDDLRDAVGCYGNATVKTPNIDRLAKHGVRFERAYAQYPVCNPSRTSFLTGLRCEQTGVVNNTTMFRKKMPDVVTLPQLLKQNGWHTASYGKVFHVGEWKGEIREGWNDLDKSWDVAEMFQATSAGIVVQGRNLTDGKLKWCEWGATGGTDDDQPDGQTALNSIRTIETSSQSGRPWMVGAGFHRPHDPFLVPTKYLDMYPTGSLKLYRDPKDLSPEHPLTIAGGAFKEAFDAFTDEDRLEFLRAYYAGVTFMDAQVGRLLGAMDRLNLWDKTVVVFMGDNGYHLNERNWWNKNTLFERSCRVPLIVAAPGCAKGEVCKTLVELVDLYPTVVDYCSLKQSHQLAGKSLRPLLDNPQAEKREAAFTLVSRGDAGYGQTVRTPTWRYVRWSDGTDELYDERTDQEEAHDVSADLKNSAVLEEMRSLLDKIGPPQQAR